MDDVTSDVRTVIDDHVFQGKRNIRKRWDRKEGRRQEGREGTMVERRKTTCGRRQVRDGNEFSLLI